jgi:hypothetical protein
LLLFGVFAIFFFCKTNLFLFFLHFLAFLFRFLAVICVLYVLNMQHVGSDHVFLVGHKIIGVKRREFNIVQKRNTC